MPGREPDFELTEQQQRYIEQARETAAETLAGGSISADPQLAEKQAGGVGLPPSANLARWPATGPPRWVRIFASGQPATDDLDSLRRLEPGVAARVSAYLATGVTILEVADREADVLDPGSGLPVGRAVKTDGIWIWGESIDYYIERYGLAPADSFIADLEARKYSARHPTEAEIDAALREALNRR